MIWKKHTALEGKHALFSASSPYWIKYSKSKIRDYIRNKHAAELGSKIHEWAKTTIDLRIKQSVPKGKVRTIQSYVNDAIADGMDTEVLLYYSDNVFGTADAISFRNGTLRIYDLKTGKGPVHEEQLMVYAALFCLEYNKKPHEIDEMILRIYQNDAIREVDCTPDEIETIMKKIREVDEVTENE